MESERSSLLLRTGERPEAGRLRAQIGKKRPDAQPFLVIRAPGFILRDLGIDPAKFWLASLASGLNLPAARPAYFSLLSLSAGVISFSGDRLECDSRTVLPSFSGIRAALTAGSRLRRRRSLWG